MGIPFIFRFLFLLILLSLIAFIDWHKNGAAAKKWKEYSFIVGVGMIGVLFAICVDSITSKISPEYFVYGKKLPSGEALRWSVLGLACEAGFSAGIITGGIYLLTNSFGKGTGLPLTTLLKLLWVPALFMLLTAGTMAWFAKNYDPGLIRPDLVDMRPREAADRFMIVWGTHAGLYLGLVFGLMIGCLVVRRRIRGLTLSASESQKNA
jgi:hypothetical protein